MKNKSKCSSRQIQGTKPIYPESWGTVPRTLWEAGRVREGRGKGAADEQEMKKTHKPRGYESKEVTGLMEEGAMLGAVLGIQTRRGRGAARTPGGVHGALIPPRRVMSSHASHHRAPISTASPSSVERPPHLHQQRVGAAGPLSLLYKTSEREGGGESVYEYQLDPPGSHL